MPLPSRGMNLRKKNCLLIVIDCLRADKALSIKNSSLALKFLIRNGVTFTHCIAPASTTTPCFGSILTGCYPLTHGIRSVYGFKLNKEVLTIQEVFKMNGYNTYAFVTGPLLPEMGLNRGFDGYEYRDHNIGVSSKWFQELVLKFKTKQFKEPWFILLHLFDLHRSKRDLFIYWDDALRVRIKINLRDFLKGREARYHQALLSIDEKLFELLNCLDLDNTLIIVTGDHGELLEISRVKEFSNEFKKDLHIIGQKVNLKWLIRFDSTTDKKIIVGHGFHVYDYLIRVPLILVDVNTLTKGGIISEMVRQIDIFPTIVDILDLIFKGLVHGESILNLTKGKYRSQRIAYIEACGAVLGSVKNWRFAIRTPRYKYVCALYNEKIPEELYDLEKDPEERNIAEIRRDLVQIFRKRLHQIRKECLSLKEKLKVQRKIYELKCKRLLHK